MKSVLKSRALVSALKRKLLPKTMKHTQVVFELGKRLGYSAIQIYNWQTKNTRVTSATVANLVLKAQQNAQSKAIQPIVEFYDFTPVNEKINRDGQVVKTYKRFKLFASENLYEKGLKEQLLDKRGIYIFYDSRGRALYVGKASDQSLWNEMNLVLNRPRAVQKVRRVSHPVNNVRFRKSEEKSRQISSREVELHGLAKYFSAYEVSTNVIGVFEAMLVRSFANDLLNIKMENFSSGRPKRKRKYPAKKVAV